MHPHPKFLVTHPRSRSLVNVLLHEITKQISSPIIIDSQCSKIDVDFVSLDLTGDLHLGNSYIRPIKCIFRLDLCI